MVTRVTFGTAGNDKLTGSGGKDVVFGLGGNDTIWGFLGDDVIFSGTGNDKINAGAGHDVVFAGHGNDVLRGGSGNDFLVGGAGADQFVFDPSNVGEGRDRIGDFTVGTDKISLSVADILRADRDIITKTGDRSFLDATDFDADASWDIVASHDGDVVIVHPSGRIELDGIAFGASTDSFADLLPALMLTGAVAGTSANDHLAGSDGEDAIFGLAGNDFLVGGRGDDVLVGGGGNDKFFFNPNRQGEGHDVIYDFALGTDKVQLRFADILASTPGLLGLSGDPNAFETTDLDASTLWNLSASSDGDLLVTHPNGTIELNGIKFNQGLSTFGAILPALEII